MGKQGERPWVYRAEPINKNQVKDYRNRCMALCSTDQNMTLRSCTPNYDFVPKEIYGHLFNSRFLS